VHRDAQDIADSVSTTFTLKGNAMSIDTAGMAQMDRLGRILLEKASEAIVFSDGQGIIRFWSPGAERMFGFMAAEAVGQSLDIIIPEPQRARHWEGFSRVMATGESRYGDGDLMAVPGLRKDGTRISLEFTIIPLFNENGQMEGMTAILRDATKRFEEMRALRRELAAACAALER
jgi:PAS domain S-box-containing protein